MVTLITLFGRGEPCILAHRPEAAAIHVGLDAPGERKSPPTPRRGDLGNVINGVDLFYLNAGISVFLRRVFHPWKFKATSDCVPPMRLRGWARDALLHQLLRFVV